MMLMTLCKSANDEGIVIGVGEDVGWARSFTNASHVVLLLLPDGSD